MRISMVEVHPPAVVIVRITSYLSGSGKVAVGFC